MASDGRPGSGEFLLLDAAASKEWLSPRWCEEVRDEFSPSCLGPSYGRPTSASELRVVRHVIPFLPVLLVLKELESVLDLLGRRDPAVRRSDDPAISLCP